jgi:hypothetical protein
MENGYLIFIIDALPKVNPSFFRCSFPYSRGRGSALPSVGTAIEPWNPDPNRNLRLNALARMWARPILDIAERLSVI